MSKLTLWGFDGSTYVRTVKMLLAVKNHTDFEQVPLDVLKGGAEDGRASRAAPVRQGAGARPRGPTRPSLPATRSALPTAISAPIAFYVSLTPDKDKLFDVPGFADWWTRVQALPSYQSTMPNLG